MIPYGRQVISEEDIDAVVQVLRSEYLTQGPTVPRFEDEIARYCGVDHAVAVNSATSALHIACLALGVGPGDRVWTVPNTFVASANCALYCGATVDFVDIELTTYNLSVDHLAHKLAEADRTGKLPKVLIPVHFAGTPCDLEPISRLAHRYGVRIIEDASHAIGARYYDSAIGECRFSDITIFSFHPVKIITTGEGGLATTRTPELAEAMRLFRSHGVTRDSTLMAGVDPAPWYYEQKVLGFNYRMTDIAAALGLSQLRRADVWVETRHRLADYYDEALASSGVTLPTRPAQSRSGLHLYPVLTDGRDKVFAALRKGGVGVNVHYIPVHTQPYYRNLGFSPGDFPNSETYYGRCLSLPMHAALTRSDQDRVVSLLKSNK